MSEHASPKAPPVNEEGEVREKVEQVESHNYLNNHVVMSACEHIQLSDGPAKPDWSDNSD